MEAVADYWDEILVDVVLLSALPAWGCWNLNPGTSLGTLGVEAMSRADVCWGWQNSLEGLTALCSPGPQKARLAASPLGSRSRVEARLLPLRGGRPMLPKVGSLACTPRPSNGKQSNKPDSWGLSVVFSISSSLPPPPLLTAGAIGNQHLGLGRQNSVLPTQLTSADSWFTLIHVLTALRLQYWSHSTPIYSCCEGVAVGGRAKSTAGSTISLTGSKGHQLGREIQNKLTCPSLDMSYTIAVEKEACLNF